MYDLSYCDDSELPPFYQESEECKTLFEARKNSGLLAFFTALETLAASPALTLLLFITAFLVCLKTIQLVDRRERRIQRRKLHERMPAPETSDR